MDKKVMLTMDFDKANAPQPLKDAASVHKKNFMRMKKAEDQFQKWNVEREAAKAEFKTSLRRFNQELDQWQPDSSALEEIK